MSLALALARALARAGTLHLWAHVPPHPTLTTTESPMTTHLTPESLRLREREPDGVRVLHGSVPLDDDVEYQYVIVCGPVDAATAFRLARWAGMHPDCTDSHAGSPCSSTARVQQSDGLDV